MGLVAEVAWPPASPTSLAKDFMKSLHKPSTKPVCEKEVRRPVCRNFSLSEVATMTVGFNQDLLEAKGKTTQVYLGFLQSGEELAVKMYRRGCCTAFAGELAAASKLRHRNLARLVGFCDERDSQILVYRYESTGSLGARLQGQGLSLPPLNMKDRLSIGRGIAEGLHYLHSHGFVHGNLKPYNILLDENLVPKIGGFGSIIDTNNLGPSQSAQAVRQQNSLKYMDPECFHSKRSRMSSSIDIYSLGVVLLELLAVKAKEPEIEEDRNAQRENGGYDSSGDEAGNKYECQSELSLRASATEDEGSSAEEVDELERELGGMRSLVEAELGEIIPQRFRYLSSDALLLRNVAESYLSLALCCMGPSRQRPALVDVIAQLAVLERHWTRMRATGDQYSPCVGQSESFADETFCVSILSMPLAH